ncbi:hypothetical protein BN946_scf184825.g1 [Trametes cinnabarina]|uniref:Zn(2)-C6 fungal-type domain-containing protein n=1 Tax=Pycnoporus cinnabarinus TaxID=5643 RepID=A0A060SLY6_PYCCI|nr:hypothetical protein BN946_scf184825.g1 [Trametes cinnabarina]
MSRMSFGGHDEELCPHAAMGNGFDVPVINTGYMHALWDQAIEPAWYANQPGSMHYIPPHAISTRYYTLSDPNVYPHGQPSIPTPVDHDTSETVGATPVTQSTASAGAVELHQPHVTAVNPPQTPAPSRSPARAYPVLPKQRRNRDYPCGDPVRVAQGTAQREDQPAAVQNSPLSEPRAPSANSKGAQTRRDPTVEVENAQARTDFFGKHGHAEQDAQTTRRAATAEFSVDMNTSAVYSPTTGRKVPVGRESGKPALNIAPGTTAAKRPYKRGTPVACVSCRKRKVACGGPQEGDLEGRCG